MANDDLEGMVTVLLDPTKYDLNLKKFEQYWEKTEIVIPSHELAQKYMELNSVIPKIAVYILFKRVFGNPHKSENGLLGYPLSLNDKLHAA